MSHAKLTARLEQDFAPILGDAGLDLEDILIQSAGKRQVVRVLVDKDDRVSLDDVAAATKQLSTELDRSNAMGERSYVLEVSSPGVERPLTAERHWRRNIGRLVRIVYMAEQEPVVGRIVAAQGDEVTIDVVESDSRLTIARTAIRKAVVQVEMNAPKGEDQAAEGEDHAFEGENKSDKGRK